MDADEAGVGAGAGFTRQVHADNDAGPGTDWLSSRTGSRKQAVDREARKSARLRSGEASARQDSAYLDWGETSVAIRVALRPGDRKRVVMGNRVDLGGRRIIGRHRSRLHQAGPCRQRFRSRN